MDLIIALLKLSVNYLLCLTLLVSAVCNNVNYQNYLEQQTFNVTTKPRISENPNAKRRSG